MAADNTRKALAAYDADQPRRDALFEAIDNDADVWAWEAEEKAALELVQRAFYQDTQGFNSLDNCLRVDIGYMRKIAALYEGITNQEAEEFELYLKGCTDAQVLGVLEKERAARRPGYSTMARQEAARRKLPIPHP